MTQYTGRPRSIFGPLVLIGIGAILLMINLGLMESARLIHLARLWPLLLVGAGINLLFQRMPWVGNIVAILLVGGALAFLYFAPQLGLETPGGGDLITESFSEPLEAATAADIRLDIDRGTLNVSALEGGTDLFQAEVNHNQRVTFTAGGSQRKDILLRLDAVDFADLFDLLTDVQMTTTVGLSPSVPLNFDADLGAGNGTLDLSGLTLTAIDASAGSGSLTALLPGGEYPVELNAGSGSLTVTFAPDAVIDLSGNIGSGRISLTLGAGVSGSIELDAGSGNINITLPQGVGVQVIGETGSGNIRLPDGFVRVDGTEQPGPGDKGTWQTAGFDDAVLKLYLELSVGSGNVTLEFGD
ncbi:MAG: hypothetical protein EPO32_04750 [Anaerolineae bacterium]|nr:MAG: hypothetical protein EPO32_04750 [Anaerolineae bacterium]